MSLSVLVADDSKLSRRSVIRALPPELEVTIEEATNGCNTATGDVSGVSGVRQRLNEAS